jgi:hypothetical protein
MWKRIGWPLVACLIVAVTAPWLISELLKSHPDFLKSILVESVLFAVFTFFLSICLRRWVCHWQIAAVAVVVAGAIWGVRVYGYNRGIYPLGDWSHPAMLSLDLLAIWLAKEWAAAVLKDV